VPDSIIETADLRKTYGDVDALAGLTLSVPRGSICGLLGRNGAGKTTTIKVLLGMAKPTSGKANVFGLPADDERSSVDIRRRAAFVSEDRDLYDSMTVAQIIRFTARFYPRWRSDLAHEYLQKFELPHARAVKTLSRGMRTKLALLLALSSGAELMILDEPTAGLDPAVTETVLQALVAHAARAQTTVFLSTHQLTDVEQIADRVAIIDRGRAVVDGSLDDIRAGYRRIQLVFDGAAPEAVFRAPGLVGMRREGRVLTLLARNGAERIVEEARALKPVSVDVLPVTLKEVFLESVAAENADALV
jgi:ABC-2 type transport system ATP-binding protein